MSSASHVRVARENTFDAALVASELGAMDKHPCLSHPLTLSFGRRALDNRPVARAMSFGDLVQEFSQADLSRGKLMSADYHALDKAVPAEKKSRDREKDGPYFVPCTFIGDGRRCNENVGEICGIALDFDSGKTTMQLIQEKLSGCAYLVYSSYSYTPELEKLRAFVPFKDPVRKERHKLVYEHFQNLFEGDIDTHCVNPSQLWYTPSCPPDAGASFQSFYATGALFNPGELQDDATSSNAEAVGGGSSDRVTEETILTRLKGALAVIPSDNRKTWVDFGLAIKHDLRDAGLAPWLEWSRKSTKFDFDDALKTWASFKDENSGPKITLRSVFYMARELGWTEDREGDGPPAHVARLNENHFLALQGGTARIFREGVDPLLDGRHLLQPMKIADFKVLFANQRICVQDGDGKPKNVSVADVWLTHREHRQYDGLVFAPTRDVPGYYNLWRGFAVAPQAGSWTLMQEHIRSILCKGDEGVFEYVLSWLAFCVQHPDRRAEVAIVLCGGRGVGKGMFAAAVGAMFGQHFVQISNAKHLTGNFNAHLRDCVVLFVDEAFWAGDKQGEAVLKHYITEATLPIEGKGRDLEIVPNLLHVIMASNSQWVIPAGLDERRFLVLNVDSSKQQDKAYFAALNDEIENGGREAMLHDLLQRDIKHFNHRQAPKTKGLIDQKLLSLEPHQHWYFERLQCGTLTGFKDDWEFASTEWVHDNYVESLKKTGTSRRSTQTELGMRLRSLLPEGYPRRVKRECTVQNIHVQRPHYQFPPLTTCRKYFEALVGLDGYDWEGEVPTGGPEGGQPLQPF